LNLPPWTSAAAERIHGQDTAAPPFQPDVAAAMVRRMSSQDSFLSELPRSFAAALSAAARPVKLAPDQVLFFAGDPGDGCYRVEEGLLKVGLVSSGGAERILAVMGPGSLVGELALLDGQPRSATVTAVRETRLSFMPAAAFEALASADPRVYRHLTAVLAGRLRRANEAVVSASYQPLKGRVARVLLDLADAFGKDVGGGRILVHQKVTQGDIGAMAGVARENASRILNGWIKAGLVSRLSGYYCIEKRAPIAAELDDA
jgi:CRP-like cAMP-binding protein